MQNKSKKLTSRLLSALLALACVLTLLPGVAVAAETMTMLKKEEGSMVLEKGAVLEDDGTYTIQLSAYATGTTTMVPQESSVPLDIVLVLDQSGSMAGSNLTALRTAVTNFVQTIKEARANADYVVAVVHWGTEHTTVLEDVQRSSAREYIDAGADVIIGGHSHCLQGIEYYEDKPIFYSLGNFWFDEYNVDTMLVNIRISGNDYGDKIDVSVVPAVQDGTLQGCVTHICTQEEDKSRIFSLLNKVSINANVADDGTVTQVK